MTSGYVYAVECGERIKLGFSENPDRRFNKIASDAPYPCSMLGYWPASKADELDIHSKFSGIRVHGEWFLSTQDLLQFISDNAMTVVSPTDKRFEITEDDTALARWRKSQKKPAKHFCGPFGVTQATWSRWETGRLNVNTTKLKRLMALTGLTLEELRPDIFGTTANEVAA